MSLPLKLFMCEQQHRKVLKCGNNMVVEDEVQVCWPEMAEGHVIFF